MKNKFILAITKALQKWVCPSRGKGRKLLVVSTTALGDTLWATPALESLRKTWPDVWISVLTSPIGEEVLRHNPWTDQIFVMKEPLLTNGFRLWRRLKKEGFHEVVILHASQRLLLPLCSLLGAHRIIGTSGINKGLDALLTDPMPPTDDHEIVRRLKLIEKLGATRHCEQLSFFLQPEERTIRPSRKPRVALHPGSKDRFKRWPKEHFIQVGQNLAKLEVDICITGTSQETELMQHIASSIPGAFLLGPALTLRPFAAELEHFDLLISNDTGPVHLACALGVPVIALYASTNPSLCGPHLANSGITLAKPPTCTPCLKRKCRRPFCFYQIGPEEVISEAKKRLLGE